jgi:hypothetical protein
MDNFVAAVDVIRDTLMVIEDVTGGTLPNPTMGEKLIADANAISHDIMAELNARFENTSHLASFWIADPKLFQK